MNVVCTSMYTKNALNTLTKNSIGRLNRSDRLLPRVEHSKWSIQCYSSCSGNFFNDSKIRYVSRRDKLARHFRSTAIASKEKNFYDTLGVSKSASKDEIKSKYREMAKKCHPDLNRDDKSAEERFKEITAAYEVLENDSKRHSYDNYGFDGIEVR